MRQFYYWMSFHLNLISLFVFFWVIGVAALSFTAAISQLHFFKNLLQLYLFRILLCHFKSLILNFCLEFLLLKLFKLINWKFLLNLFEFTNKNDCAIIFSDFFIVHINRPTLFVTQRIVTFVKIHGICSHHYFVVQDQPLVRAKWDYAWFWMVINAMESYILEAIIKKAFGSTVGFCFLCHAIFSSLSIIVDHTLVPVNFILQFLNFENVRFINKFWLSLLHLLFVLQVIPVFFGLLEIVNFDVTSDVLFVVWTCYKYIMLGNELE